ncbi:hypothetical protein N9Y26_01365 [bacterium]|nr:hypothetical protein [bacterium]
MSLEGPMIAYRGLFLIDKEGVVQAINCEKFGAMPKKRGLKTQNIGEQVFETDFVPSPKFCGLFKDTMTR